MNTAATDLAPSMLPRPFRITRVRREVSDVFSWELEPADGGLPPAYVPGQFNMLYLHGVGEVPISISGDPSGETLVHTVRAVGAVTEVMRKLGKGDEIGVRGPFGVGWPVAEAEGNDLLIVAGGLGLAPLRPAIYHVLANRARYGSVAIYYGARTPADILFRKELERWRGRFDLFVEATVDAADIRWAGRVGVVPKLIDPRRHSFDPDNSVAMICGPEIMMRFTVSALQAHGVPDQRLFVSMERNMHCAIGLCGHCQLGPEFICKDGPVFSFDRIGPVFHAREL
ncbi:MAG: Ni/Fe hydrogenase subunit gamma [Gammaproteobacteria bacterium]|nr:MAG: Ni/Fe hydrogenase subunit gamma [Gammaproteobacteria bacterium]